MEIHVETFDDIYKKNAAISIERLFKYVQNSSKNTDNEVRIILYSPQKQDTDNLIKTFLDSPKEMPPVLFIGAEKFEDYPKIGLLKHFLNGGYIKAPFNITEFLIYVDNLVSTPPPPPQSGRSGGGAELEPPENLVNKLCEFLDDKDIKVFGSREDKFEEISDLFFNKNRSRGKEQHGVHDLQKPEEKATKIEELNKKHDYCEFVYAMGTDVFKSKLKILIIDNNPNSLLDDIKIISKYFEKISFFVHKFEKKDKESYSSENIERITYKNIKDDRVTHIVYVASHINSNGEEQATQDINNFDLILLDLNLTDDDSIRGEDILNNLYSFCPEIPVFILSSIEDTLTIRKTLFTGADDYIPKSRLMALPFRINKYLEEIGEIVWLIEDKNLRRNLIGNLRRWRFNKEILWFGDKCYHMVNHSYNHAENNWKLMNQIFPSFHRKMRITDEDIYCLCMSTWLHDIGHAGNDQYGEPHNVRDCHSVISAELILKHPEYYMIFGYAADNKSPYRYTTFRRPKTALQCIRERISTFSVAMNLLSNSEESKINLNKQMILEKISLMCIYHSSKFPIDEKDIVRITGEKKSLSRECYENLDKKTEPIHLASITSMLGDKNIILLTSILRLVDAIDHNKNRVGDNTSRSIKVETIQRDLRYQLTKLEREVEHLINFSKMNPEKAKRFKKLFFDQVEEKILENISVSDQLKGDQRNFLDSYDGDINMTNYDLLLEYIQYIRVQDRHFDLHNSIDAIDIKTDLSEDGRILLDIRFKTSKRKEDLEKIRVKTWEEKEDRSLPIHLLGKRDNSGELKKKENGEYEYVGYIRKELESAKDYIKHIFNIEGHRVGIYDMSGNKQYYP